MKVEIKDFCVRCGICTALYPELFAHNYSKDRIDAYDGELSAQQMETAKNAIKDCAVSAIHMVK